MNPWKTIGTHFQILICWFYEWLLHNLSGFCSFWRKVIKFLLSFNDFGLRVHAAYTLKSVKHIWLILRKKAQKRVCVRLNIQCSSPGLGRLSNVSIPFHSSLAFSSPKRYFSEELVGCYVWEKDSRYHYS